MSAIDIAKNNPIKTTIAGALAAFQLVGAVQAGVAAHEARPTADIMGGSMDVVTGETFGPAMTAFRAGVEAAPPVVQLLGVGGVVAGGVIGANLPTGNKLG